MNANRWRTAIVRRRHARGSWPDRRADLGKCKDRRREGRTSIAPAPEAPTPACRDACRCGPSRSKRDIEAVSGSWPQRLQSRGNHPRRRIGADPNPGALHVHFDDAGVGTNRPRQCRRRRQWRLDDHRRKSASVRVHCPPRRSPPFVDEARANIFAARHLGDDRARFFDRRQNPNPIFVAPSTAPLAAHDQCHPTHAVQLASLIKPT